jgi:hypothetical protein
MVISSPHMLKVVEDVILRTLFTSKPLKMRVLYITQHKNLWLSVDI